MALSTVIRHALLKDEKVAMVISTIDYKGITAVCAVYKQRGGGSTFLESEKVFSSEIGAVDVFNNLVSKEGINA